MFWEDPSKARRLYRDIPLYFIPAVLKKNSWSLRRERERASSCPASPVFEIDENHPTHDHCSPQDHCDVFRSREILS